MHDAFFLDIKFVFFSPSPLPCAHAGKGLLCIPPFYGGHHSRFLYRGALYTPPLLCAPLLHCVYTLCVHIVFCLLCVSIVCILIVCVPTVTHIAFHCVLIALYAYSFFVLSAFSVCGVPFSGAPIPLTPPVPTRAHDVAHCMHLYCIVCCLYSLFLIALCVYLFPLRAVLWGRASTRSRIFASRACYSIVSIPFLHCVNALWPGYLPFYLFATCRSSLYWPYVLCVRFDRLGYRSPVASPPSLPNFGVPAIHIRILTILVGVPAIYVHGHP